MEKTKKEIAGIDVSKASIDVWLYYGRLHRVFNNNPKGFTKMLQWIKGTTGANPEEVAFCFEHTGLYSYPLSCFLHEKGCCFYLVSGLLVKRSLGLVRGKNDKVDAVNLARFAFLHRQELKPYQLPSESVMQLKQLLSFREKLVRQCSAHKSYLQEMTAMLEPGDSLFIQISRELIKITKEKIKTVEQEMLSLIKQDEALEKTYRNITSIKGVGMVLAVAMIAFTNNFESFSNWRKFACYAGIAPFEHQSGTSYKGKTRVSSLGNRKIKSLLSMAAVSAIQYDPEMKEYFQRRISEGKSKMSTLNIIRNKLVSRIFAVAKRQTPYVDIRKYAA